MCTVWEAQVFSVQLWGPDGLLWEGVCVCVCVHCWVLCKASEHMLAWAE